MIKPLTTQSSYLAHSGRLDLYRSGTEGRIRNDGEVARINGFAIDLTGTTSKLVRTVPFAAGAGIDTVAAEQPRGLLASSTLAASIQLQNVPSFSAEALAAAKARGGASYVAAVPETVEIHFTPIGAEPQPVEGLGFVPGEVLQSGTKVDHVARQIARAGELARIETRLSEEQRADLKIAFDPLAEEYVVLRPGQPGYDRVTSAREVFAEVVRDVPKMGDRGAYRDVLAQYGIGA